LVTELHVGFQEARPGHVQPIQEGSLVAALSAELKPAIGSGDETRAVAILEELKNLREKHPQEVEGLLAWGILAGCELKCDFTREYVSWFMDTYPNSPMPVRIEYAQYLANSDQPDDASEIARAYLRLIRDQGTLSKLAQFPTIQVGVTKAFWIVTAATTHVGARSYSKRVLIHAGQFVLATAIAPQLASEITRLERELAHGEAQRKDTVWEAFFQTGAKGIQLAKYCESLKCPRLATRVELIEGRFRFNAGSGYQVREDETYELVMEAKLPDGKIARVMR
jgi:hypothetical protein